ncbi:MAG TPA: hypothetical protein VL854_01175 [Nitrososphaeraceae archaeon]|nr:hypothetical protein [Nitrososphaeraceae archaeon]
MSLFSKTITLRVPSDIIYRALKDSRLENLFPEYFVGVKRKLAVDKKNKELIFETRTQDSPIQIIEKFKLIITGDTFTEVKYDTEVNVDENEVVVLSIVQTHIANVLYSLLMLETGYLNGLMKMRGMTHVSSWEAE